MIGVPPAGALRWPFAALGRFIATGVAVHKVLAIGGGLVLMLAFSSVAAARGPGNEFAVGSVKSDVTVVLGNEHASFSAHSTTGPRCEATGQIVYKSDYADFTAQIVELTIVGKGAFFGGPITRVRSGPVTTSQSVYFYATDSGMPGGTGDTFQYAYTTPKPEPGFVLCFPPATGAPITQGNIVISTNILP